MAKPSRTNRHKSSLPKLIEKYYADLADLARQNVLFEMGTRPAFHALLQAVGKEHGWTLIAEQEKKVNGKTIRPDGTFKDEMNLVRGFWEAKDTADKLDVEIEKKRKAGPPTASLVTVTNVELGIFWGFLRNWGSNFRPDFSSCKSWSHRGLERAAFTFPQVPPG